MFLRMGGRLERSFSSTEATVASLVLDARRSAPFSEAGGDATLEALSFSA